MRAFVVAALVSAAVLFARSPLAAQVPDHYDTSRVVTIKGTVAGFSVGPGAHSYLLVETKNATGGDETWAVEGDGVGVLMKVGWKIKEVKVGDSIGVTAYALKRSAPPIEVGNVPPSIMEAVKARRVAHGIEVTFSDGKKLPFGPGK